MSVPDIDLARGWLEIGDDGTEAVVDLKGNSKWDSGLVKTSFTRRLIKFSMPRVSGSSQVIGAEKEFDNVERKLPGFALLSG